MQEEKKGEKCPTAFANNETVTSPIKKQKTAFLIRKPKSLMRGSSNNDGRRGNVSSDATATNSKLTAGTLKPQSKRSASQKRTTERLRQRKAQRNKVWTRLARKDVGSRC